MSSRSCSRPLSLELVLLLCLELSAENFNFTFYILRSFCSIHARSIHLLYVGLLISDKRERDEMGCEGKFRKFASLRNAINYFLCSFPSCFTRNELTMLLLPSFLVKLFTKLNDAEHNNLTFTTRPSSCEIFLLLSHFFLHIALKPVLVLPRNLQDFLYILLQFIIIHHNQTHEISQGVRYVSWKRRCKTTFPHIFADKVRICERGSGRNRECRKKKLISTPSKC